MNKRLRKKKEVGEFAVFGFIVNITIPPGHRLVTDEAHLAFWDAMIDFAESHDLVCGGPLTETIFHRCTCRGCTRDRTKKRVPPELRKTTDADREAVESWLRAQPLVVNVDVGPLVDLNYIK